MHSHTDTAPDDERRDSHQETTSSAKAFVTNDRLVQLVCKLSETRLSTWSGWFAVRIARSAVSNRVSTVSMRLLLYLGIESFTPYVRIASTALKRNDSEGSQGDLAKFTAALVGIALVWDSDRPEIRLQKCMDAWLFAH